MIDEFNRPLLKQYKEENPNKKFILFTHYGLFLNFVYTFASKFKFTKKDFNNLDGILIESDDFVLYYNSFVKVENTLLKTDIFDKILFDVDVMFHFYGNENKDKGKKYLKKLSKITNLTLVLIKADMFDWLAYEFLEFGLSLPNVNCITSTKLDSYTDDDINHEMILDINVRYFLSTDFLFGFPSIPEFELKDKKYDFIYYYGLDYHKKRKDIRYNNTIGKIDFNDKTVLNPNINKQISYNKKLLKSIFKVNTGASNWYSLIECELAKIKLVNESNDLTEDNDKYFYFSEKTLKCFIHSQPYILFLHPIHKKYLRNLGFKFVETDDSIDSTIEMINKLCQSDIDKWIKRYAHIFKHNKKLFQKILSDCNHPMNEKLEQIILWK
jgi:hypothetical protein